MNTLSKLLPLTLLFLISSITVYAKTTPNRIPQIDRKQNQSIPAEALQVALAESVLITSKQGDLIRGKLANFNSKELILTVANGSPRPLAISQIRQVDFPGEVWIRVGSGYRKLRGENRTTRKQRTWQGVPINAFNLQPDRKTALLKLKTILSQRDLLDLQALSKTIVYVIDDISFDTSGQKMTVRATPVDRKAP